jgi:hypothetical protein
MNALPLSPDEDDAMPSAKMLTREDIDRSRRRAIREETISTGKRRRA